jgi:hypothetical protein
MSMGFRADPTNTSGVITVAGVDQVVVTNASNVVATTFTGALAGNADTATNLATTTGTAPVYGVRAWVSFDGTKDTSGAASTANTKRFIYGGGLASGNVTNVLRNAAGDYTINFSTAMQDTNYCCVASCSHSGVYGGIAVDVMSNISGSNGVTPPTTSAVRLVVQQPNVGNLDVPYVNVIVIR